MVRSISKSKFTNLGPLERQPGFSGWNDDSAMMSKEIATKRAHEAVSQDLGGIALNARMMDLQIKRDGNGVALPIGQQSLDRVNIQGFVPQIISIQPVDLPALLGTSSAPLK